MAGRTFPFRVPFTSRFSTLMRFAFLRSALALALSAFLFLAPGRVLAESWLVVSGLSWHFQQEREHWRQHNPGLGIETALAPVPGLYLSAGSFLNSYNRQAVYGGVRFMPVSVGPFALGGYLLASTGYPSPVLLLPGAALDMGPFGLNLVALPNLPGYSGYVGVQLRLRLP